MTKMLFNITHGFQARMLLRSQVAETVLGRDAELLIYSANAREEYFRSEFDLPGVTLREMPARFSRIESRAMNLRQYFLMNPALGGTLNHKRETFRRERPLWSHLSRGVNLVLGRSRHLRDAYMAMEQRFFPGSEWDQELTRQRPDLVVTGTPGFNQFDAHLLRAAKRHGIPTATVMLSWDNLTSKGYMNGTPDHLLVWSELMAEEAVEYHGYPGEQIHQVGAAQFDQYFGREPSFDVARWKQEHSVPADRPLIFYGTINPGVLGHELAILKSIVAAIENGKFKRRPYLWVRLHPQVINGPWKRPLEEFKNLAGPDVHVEEPPVVSERLAWDLPKSDAEHLTGLLLATDVVATPSSTLVIDAACVGTPSISVFFDGAEQVRPELAARRFESYTHYAKILATGGIGKAYTLDEFVRQVDDIVEHPKRYRDGCAAVTRQQLGSFDGRAGRRTAERLLEIAEQGALERDQGESGLGPLRAAGCDKALGQVA